MGSEEVEYSYRHQSSLFAVRLTAIAASVRKDRGQRVEGEISDLVAEIRYAFSVTVQPCGPIPRARSTGSSLTLAQIQGRRCGEKREKRGSLHAPSVSSSPTQGELAWLGLAVRCRSKRPYEQYRLLFPLGYLPLSSSPG